MPNNKLVTYIKTHLAIVITIGILLVSTITASAAQLLAPSGSKPSDIVGLTKKGEVRQEEAKKETTAASTLAESSSTSSILPKSSLGSSTSITNNSLSSTSLSESDYEVFQIKECNLAINYPKLYKENFKNTGNTQKVIFIDKTNEAPDNTLLKNYLIGLDVQGRSGNAYSFLECRTAANYNKILDELEQDVAGQYTTLDKISFCSLAKLTPDFCNKVTDFKVGLRGLGQKYYAFKTDAFAYSFTQGIPDGSPDIVHMLATQM